MPDSSLSLPYSFFLAIRPRITNHYKPLNPIERDTQTQRQVLAEANVWPLRQMHPLCSNKGKREINAGSCRQENSDYSKHSAKQSRQPSAKVPITLILSVILLCLVAQSCPTLCNPMDCSPPGSSAHGGSPGKNTGVGCHFLFQGIFPIQDWSQISCIASRFFTDWATKVALDELLPPNTKWNHPLSSPKLKKKILTDSGPWEVQTLARDTVEGQVGRLLFWLS